MSKPETPNRVGSTDLLDRVNSWLETWSPHCGAPRAVFEGQFRVTLREIFDEIERRAEANMLKTGKLEGMHYAALKDVRRELSATRSNSVISDTLAKTHKANDVDKAT